MQALGKSGGHHKATASLFVSLFVVLLLFSLLRPTVHNILSKELVASIGGIESRHVTFQIKQK